MEPSTSMGEGDSSKSHRGRKRTASTSLDQGFPSESHSGQKRPRSPNLTAKQGIFLSQSGVQKESGRQLFKAIFLSHSGKQKEFVRQLFKDLNAETHEPFFDEDDSSLPKAEWFAELILEAARQCLVAVIVLSEDFLTSKWPMFELVEFVKAKRSHNPKLRLFPLFYTLSVGDLTDDSSVKRWEAAWRKINSKLPEKFKLDLTLYGEAFRELRGTNGLKFEDFHGEVKFREAIVKQISSIIPPSLLYDTSDIIGIDRLCEVIRGMFVEDKSEGTKLYGTFKLGLYGMSGLGKTTMSKAVCNSFHKDFNGRVLHVELGSKSPLDLQKLVLTELLRINKGVVKRVQCFEQGLRLLKKYMNRQTVFLVIDNVTNDEDSKKEAQSFLELGFHRGSMIMVTSTSLDVVEDLFPSESNASYSKAMPEVSEEEARLIFMRRVAPDRDLDTLTMEERKILDECISEGLFWVDNFERQYHPLALHALGAYYHSQGKENMLAWRKHLGDHDKLRRSKASLSIFCALEKQISTYSSEAKLLFLDLCLYIKGFYSEYYSEDFKLLADFHRIPTKEVIAQLQELKRSGIIKFNIGRGMYGHEFWCISMHDLYREFAKWYVMCIEDGKKLGYVYHIDSIASLPLILDSTSPSPSPWKRIRLENLTCATFPLKRVQEWCNVVVLQIHKCSNLTKLDLYGLRCLCLLELVELPKLESFHFENPWVASNNVSNDTHESLKHVMLRGLTSLKQIPDFGMCTLLKTFKMGECEELLPKPPSFVGCSQLKFLDLDWNWKWRMEEFKLHTLTSLTTLMVRNSTWDEILELNNVNFLTVTGLDRCSQLQTLELESLGFSSLKGLEQLRELQCIQLHGCAILSEIPDLCTLDNLESLNIIGGLFEQIPGVDELGELCSLTLNDCLNLTSLPNLDRLPMLDYVNLVGCSSLIVHPKLPQDCLLRTCDCDLSCGLGCILF